MCKPLIVFTLLAVSITTFGQVHAVKVAEYASPITQTSIAVSPKNPKAMVIAGGEHLYTSTDGGNTWQASASTLPGVQKGVLLATGRGDFYYLLETTNNDVHKVMSYTSTDGGVHWDNGTLTEPLSTKDQVQPNATLDDKGNIMLTYTQYDKYTNADPNCLSSIQLTKSSGGRKWSKPVTLSQTSGHCVDDADATSGSMAYATADGKEFGVWSSRNKIFIDRAFDGKQWLSNDIAILQQSDKCDLRWNGLRCSSAPIIAIDRSKGSHKGSVYIAWSDTRAGSDQPSVSFIRSYNYGDNWTTPVSVHMEENAVQINPSLTVDQVTGYIYLTYFMIHEDNSADCYISCSTDSGQNFGQVKLNENSFTLKSGTQPHCFVTASNGIIAAGWSYTDGSLTQLMMASLKHQDLVPAKE